MNDWEAIKEYFIKNGDLFLDRPKSIFGLELLAGMLLDILESVYLQEWGFRDNSPFYISIKQ